MVVLLTTTEPSHLLDYFSLIVLFKAMNAVWVQYSGAWGLKDIKSHLPWISY